MKQKDILTILILLFIFVAAWIGSSIYHSIVNTTISETTSQDILPIQPNFDVQTINNLKQRQNLNPSFELVAATPTPSPSPIPVVIPTEIPTVEPILSPTSSPIPTEEQIQEPTPTGGTSQ